MGYSDCVHKVIHTEQLDAIFPLETRLFCLESTVASFFLQRFMMNSPELLPWFAPILSQAVTRVIINIGSHSVLEKGQSVATSAFFNRIVFVKSGFLAQGLINPANSAPFMLTLAGADSFGISTSSIDRLDNLPRRYWAATHCEIYTVNPELLLRLAEVEKSWNKELNEYALRRAVSDRLGLMIFQATNTEERLGVFLTSLFLAASRFSLRQLECATEWLRLPTPPSRKLIAAVLSCRQADIDEVLCRWFHDKVIQFFDGGLLIRTTQLVSYWQWLQPFMQMQSEYVSHFPPHTEVDFEH